MTLIATLRAFAYGWSLHKQQRNAEEILTHSRKLVERLGIFGRTFAQVGNALEMTVKRWNEAVGSFEGRLAVTAREIAQLSGETAEQTEPKPVESAVRPGRENRDARAIQEKCGSRNRSVAYIDLFWSFSRAASVFATCWLGSSELYS